MRSKIFLMLTLMLTFMACNHNDFEPMTTEEIAKANFQSTFYKTFGEPASNQDWGFDNAVIFDNTNVNVTRAHNVNGNMWYQDWERPVNVTSDEARKVLAEFSKVRENAVNDISLPFENYWVQQVHQGTAPSLDGNGNEVYPSGVMNQLMAYNFDSNSYEHVNNFNNANNTTTYTDDITHQVYEGTTLMVDMGYGDNNKQFAYHNTSDSKYHYDYIVLEIGGNYYVGFDIVGYHPQGQNLNYNMDVDRDWVFNDWIVKITPAAYNMYGGTRIIAEDLGGNESDFDYNDVVFDAKIVNTYLQSYSANKMVAYIVLRAAGGTLPLTVANREVHNLFGVNTNVMVNTGAGATRKPVSFKVVIGDANWNVNAGEVIKSIPVIVKKGDSTIKLDVETGKAPEKIAVKTTFEWTTERQPIYEKYPLFNKWVKDKTVVWY